METEKNVEMLKATVILIQTNNLPRKAGDAIDSFF
jgi:hypothetical protein